MATNLVSEIAEVFSPNIVSRIASALGLNRTATQKAIVAAATMPMINIPKKPDTGCRKLSFHRNLPKRKADFGFFIETTTRAWTRRSR